MQLSNDDVICDSVRAQRQEQVLREGVYVTFHQGQNGHSSYLEYDFSLNWNFLKLQDIFKSIKYHLDIFKIEKLEQKITIPRDQYTMKYIHDPNDWKIYLNKQILNLQHKKAYILAKNNQTIPVHTSFMLETLQVGIYDQQLEQFLKNINCDSIQLQKKQIIPFVKQQDLNPLQNQAIYRSFTNKITFIRGPPGSGKTFTISRMVAMMASLGRKVIIGSTSDVANFALINQIIKEMEKFNNELFINPQKKKIRIIIHLSLQGLDKIDAKTKKFLLNEQLCDLIMGNRLYFLKDRQEIMQKIKITQQRQKVDAEFEGVYYDCLQELMKDTTIAITTTIHSLNLRSFTNYKPEIGIVDEAAQATLSNCLRYLSFGIKRLICVGDQKQLKPFMLQKKDDFNVYHRTMFEIAQKNKNYLVQLKQQYRMNPAIAQFTNLHIYGGIITNAQITYTEHQSDIKYFQLYPTSFIEHSFKESTQYNLQSCISMNKKTKKVLGFRLEYDTKPQYYNIGQGSLIMDFLIHVIPLQKWKNTTVLTFYKKQLYEIEAGLRYTVQKQFGGKYEDYGLNVKTVDGYQGGQHDYIIISTVRSNPFINDPQFFTNMNRVNVALTRAKKGIIVFGNSETLKLKTLTQKNLNIWGHFFNFNQQRNRVLDYWSLESIMNKKNKERGAIFDAKNLYSELNYILGGLMYFQKEPKSMNKHQMSLADKNDEILQEVKQMLKWLKNTTQKDARKGKDKNIVNNFLAETRRKTKCKYVVKKSNQEAIKPLRKTLIDFMVDHLTVDEIPQVIEFFRAMLIEIQRIIVKSNDQLAETIVADNLTDIISYEVNVKRQKIHEECYKMGIKEKIESKEEKQKVQNQWISRKIMIKFVDLFDKSLGFNFQFIQYRRTKYSLDQY